MLKLFETKFIINSLLAFQASCCQHIWLYRKSYRTSWRFSHPFEQFKSPRETKSCLYHSGYRNCSRNLFTIHSFARINERIPCSWAQRAKWCIEIALIFVWIYWRNGQRLHLRSDTFIWRCSNGQVNQNLFFDRKLRFCGPKG